jgi:hypothetical protein
MNGILFVAVVSLAAIGPSADAADRQPSQELECLWVDLGTEDATKAHRAVSALVARAADTLPFLEKRLKPVPPADSRQLSGLIDDLNSNQFRARQKATQELMKQGDLADAALCKALTGRPSLEARRRIEQILDEHKNRRLWPDAGQRQLARAIDVLENIDNPAARRLLATLAQGAADAGLTRDAKGALERWGPRR